MENKNKFNTNLKIGSLFDGIGVFPLAASRYGIIPTWASEVEKAPISITKRHFPNILHIGDITKIDGGEIPPVHIITFGSPCQNLSNIGKREGLAGSKSNLFYQVLRIIEEMRCATNGVYPVIAVWENVMGAFSSNNRMDFKAVLESFTNTEIPMPATGGWANAGMVRGNNVDVCWRLLDARYWGKPTLAQRRRRIFLVADFRGNRAREILFKARNLQSFLSTSGEGRLSSPDTSQISSEKTRWEVPIVRPFQERRMRSAAKDKNKTGFIGSFGKTGDPFPTLLAGSVNFFSFWYEGKEKDGFIRQLTPLECERLMGLPEGWTAFGDQEKTISDYARYKALGNSIAVPCAEYIMAGIAESL
ncbi:DNA cytosine methyltransferase [Amphibacillus jilinensis]|uniref:DNA cytosine methyltransferase n=1 Tax=Amphibacillus jilinensis TaxID=1216008 RepID=UPI0002E0A0D0|nr:DNA (cytosine-5-)-methyltransferase [Amphibacillus jilinensis]